MADVIAELKALRLHGMAATWAELGEQRSAEVERSRWLLEHMLQAEASDRATRSVQHQMSSAKFPVHRDLASFDFEVSPVDRKLVTQLAGTPRYAGIPGKKKGPEIFRALVYGGGTRN